MIEALQGMQFYEVVLISNIGIVYNCICTYRSQEQVRQLFDEKLKRQYSVTVIQYGEEDIGSLLDAIEQDGVYCVETHVTHKSVQELAEDIMVSRLSGMMSDEI